ncbi:cysteine proteinase [Rhizoclosmatium globosum]|uniref:Cysteine proteinase n=1 Tax=Rhizoclosmatium globosum TaxID=329046 RepID=A0A1Y2C258_9FUNG|nr:cysteine proteinase [Rhizoclosmatium globosum]|eukprot:ORY41046.1 cysteine proteinase [Rhizoclosmatium globosum]
MKEEKQKPQPTNTPSTPLLSASETEVLKQASIINSKIYLPWFEDDSTDSFWTQEPFRDPDGFLKLSQEQHEKFGCWKRVPELMANPRMVSRMSSSSIVQDVVTDCSFVASLCVSAAYERKFQKQLITGCIYPQDADGMPLYNMSGKYVVKLFFNGIYRKIVVDDYLPVSKDGKLMCTYSNLLDEVWPCIIEKAYMKVNGGYDFPGSNSGIDLYALTGWIPEQIFINDYKWNAEIQWKRMMSGFKKGRALITLATIDMDEERAIKIGLVPTHAYAVLNIQEADGQRMMQLKNPWNHRRWNGKFSHLDNESWTNGIREALHFDRAKALEHDDGIFWISFDSVLQYFESIHVNWNPAMFSYQHVMHVSWPLEIGPMVDAYTFAHNPQFGLEVNATDDSSTMWLLLSKHVTTKDENKDYITLHIYENTNCHRVYYPDMYSVIHIGAYVNSPHILASIKIPQGKSRYTVVVSQNEKTRSLTFSLRAYGKHPFLFGAIGNEYPEEKEIRHRFKVGSDTKTSDIHVWEQSLTIEAGQICIMTEAQENVTLKLKFVDSKGAVIAESVGGYRPKFAFVEFALPEKGKFQAVVTVTGFSGSNDVNDIEVSLNVRSEGRITWEKV